MLYRDYDHLLLAYEKTHRCVICGDETDAITVLCKRCHGWLNKREQIDRKVNSDDETFCRWVNSFHVGEHGPADPRMPCSNCEGYAMQDYLCSACRKG